MIAKVRIAPLEKWCGPPRHPNVLIPETVLIDTASMQQTEQGDEGENFGPIPRFTRCGGKIWRNINPPIELIGNNIWTCEHMLEMD